MNIGELHRHLGELLAAGVSPDMPVASLEDGWPYELRDPVLMSGLYYGDPSPKLAGFFQKSGPFLLLEPVNSDVSDLLNNGTHSELKLPSLERGSA